MSDFVIEKLNKMKRNLIKQMANEWRENLWLVLELFIVLAAVLCVAYYLVGVYDVVHEPCGYDITDVYSMDFTPLSPGEEGNASSGEPAEADEAAKNALEEEKAQDILSLLQRVRKSPYVQYAALSINGLPCNYSFFGQNVRTRTDTALIYVNARYVSPDMALVLRYESLRGRSPEQMRVDLASGKILISPDRTHSAKHDPGELVNAMIVNTCDSTDVAVAADVIRTVRRSRFETGDFGTMIIPLPDEKVGTGQFTPNQVQSIGIRVKPGMGQKLIDEYLSDPTLRGHRHMIISRPVALDDIDRSQNNQNMIMIRLLVTFALFLLLTVFLGLLGTFWYRIRHREREIAIRMVNGATPGDIYRRLLSESFILVFISALLCAGFAAWVVLAGKFPEDYRSPYYVSQLLIGGAFTLGALLVTVAAGVTIPALRAMKVQPAIALKDE